MQYILTASEQQRTLGELGVHQGGGRLQRLGRVLKLAEGLELHHLLSGEGAHVGGGRCERARAVCTMCMCGAAGHTPAAGQRVFTAVHAAAASAACMRCGREAPAAAARTFDAFSGVSKSDHTSCVSASLSLPSFRTLNRQKPADDSKSSSILRKGEWGGSDGPAWRRRRQGPWAAAGRCCACAIHGSAAPAPTQGQGGCWAAGGRHAVGLWGPCIPPRQSGAFSGRQCGVLQGAHACRAADARGQAHLGCCCWGGQQRC